ncbi:MAG: hypothetical protein E6R05_02245 [Candidatus Moraniibacteriota bacterium]|nr:MAG: hypothetical protein E6R05_02245 [Candidatus Moranbacteria bacterium]
MKLNTSSLSSSIKTPAKAKAEKPALPVQAEVIDSLATQLDELEALEGSVDATKRELITELFPKWLDLNASSRVHNGTVVLKGEKRDIQMTFKSAFTKVPADKADLIKEAVGTTAYGEFFRQKVDAKINFDLVPEDKQQVLFDGIASLLQSLGVVNCLTLSDVIVPVDGFNEVRASKLTKSQNEALEQVQKTVVSFKRVAGVK